jgi:hypothetical protein
MKILILTTFMSLIFFKLSAQNLVVQMKTGEKIEVAENDFDKMMTWHEAKKACKELGEGWRLPSKEELKVIQKELYKKNKGNFKLIGYWSGSEINEKKAYYVHFYRKGMEGKGIKNAPTYVRAVRSI